ncbi:MAG: substrate-binding domain-containing protein [Nitrospirae bacterium]|nr:substrate-binding domain-containing protein [Nitrospirota bacterium]
MKKRHIAGPFLILLIIFMLCTDIFAASSPQLSGSGCSVSNLGYLKDLAKEYEKKTGVKMFIRGGGTVMGMEDLHSGKVDFAASCRGRKPGDYDDTEFIRVAWDALVFIAHKSNPLDNISLDSITNIYSGRITSWKELNGPNEPIKVFISRQPKGLSGVEGSLKDLVLKNQSPLKASSLVYLASTALVEQMVEDVPAGFATSGVSSSRKRDVKILKVNGIYPTKENIASGRYPFRRPLYLLISKNPGKELKKFIDYVLSKEGQGLISSYGVVPLMDVK